MIGEILIFEGNLNGNIVNERIIYYCEDNNEWIEFDKIYPDSNEKNYLFTENNNIFKLFLVDRLISYTNIDVRNCVDDINNEFKYYLYFHRKLKIIN